jgi:hypothetical protein
MPVSRMHDVTVTEHCSHCDASLIIDGVMSIVSIWLALRLA